MTIKQIAIIFGGVIFITVGILSSRHYHWKKIKTYIPIIVGLFLVYISTIGPLSESSKRIDEIISIDSMKVKSVIFQPTRYKGYEKLTMFTQDSIVTDRISIDKICYELSKSTVAEDGFVKNPSKVCRIEIHFMNNRTISFGIRKAGKVTCIVLSSDGEYGWSYANLDASEFGKLFDKSSR